MHLERVGDYLIFKRLDYPAYQRPAMSAVECAESMPSSSIASCAEQSGRSLRVGIAAGQTNAAPFKTLGKQVRLPGCPTR